MNHLLPTQIAPDIQASGAAHAILPVGSFEQHGHHLPLATDSVVAGAIARELGQDTQFSFFRPSPSPARTSTMRGLQRSACPRGP